MTSAFEPQLWPGWVGGVLLALVPVGYALLFGRLPASASRFTQLIDRVRFGPSQPSRPLSQAELVMALQAASAEAFGEQAVVQALENQPLPQRRYRTRVPITWVGHGLFLLGLAVGGRLAVPSAPFEWSLRVSDRFGELIGPWMPALMLFAGLLVGVGTRMCGGCSIGHGLCGVPLAQKGSLLSTVAFFGTGVLTAFLLGAL